MDVDDYTWRGWRGWRAENLLLGGAPEALASPCLRGARWDKDCYCACPAQRDC